jgi:hypothetical protein
MDIIQRYLHAVKPLLPKAQQDDILAEVSEDLRSQIEDREADLGRELNEDEVAAIIKKRGLPIRVASAYLPQQYLIGPMWFPLYRFVLKVVMLWVQVPVMVWIVAPLLYFTSPDPRSALLGLARQLPAVAITTFGIITFIFVCLERFQFGAVTKSFEDWDPRSLPPLMPVTAQIQPSLRSAAISELVSGIGVSLAWVYFVRFHPSVDFDIVQMSLAPVWRNNFWPILLLFMSGIPVGCIGLFRPLSARLHSSLRLAIHAGTLIFMAVVFKAGTWIEIASSKRSAVQVAEILRGYNLGIRIAFLVITIIVLAEIVQEVRRMISVKTPRPWTANGLAAL